MWFPFRAKLLCTRRNAIITVCVLPASIAILYAYELVTWDLSDEGCNFHEDHLHLMSNIHPWLTATLYSYVPAAILIVCTTAISVQLARMRKKRSEILKGKPSEAHAERRITIMIVFICVLFIVLTIPVTIYYVILFAAGGHVYQGPEMQLAETIIILLALFNHTINFFLYVVSLQKFRKELKMLCMCQRGQEDEASSSLHSNNTTRLSTVSLAASSVSIKL